MDKTRFELRPSDSKFQTHSRCRILSPDLAGKAFQVLIPRIISWNKAQLIHKPASCYGLEKQDTFSQKETSSLKPLKASPHIEVPGPLKEEGQ